MPERGSRTAMIAGATRAAHLLYDAAPHVLVDPFTYLVLPEQCRVAMLKARRNANDESMLASMRASLVWRARTTEDALEAAFARGVRQYAVMGAGFDSFAWRRGDLLPDLQVFEIDHPATQAWKRESIAELHITQPEGHHFVPADLANLSIRDAMAASRWDFTKPGFWSWIAVTMYLSRDAVAATLRAIAAMGPGTTIAFTYMQHAHLLADHEQRLLQLTRWASDKVGEPHHSYYSPEEIEAVAREAGFDLVEHHMPADSPHFRDRRDGLMPHNLELLAVASVAPSH
jgi:methyltransferase (TIGR00027 family)